MSTLQILFLNVNGKPWDNMSWAMHEHPAIDVYAFAETWHDELSCQDMGHDGYRSFHCVRASSRLHGGITVLLKDWMCSGGVQVTSDAHAGILWLDIAAMHIVLAVCYFSPPSSSLYVDGTLHQDPSTALMEGFALAHANGKHVVAVGDFNIRVGACNADVVKGCLAVKTV